MKKVKKRNFNGIDLAAVLILVTVVIAGIFFYKRVSSAGRDGEKVTVEYTLVFPSQSNSIAGMIKEGDILCDNGGKDNMGTVISVQSIPHSELSYRYSDGGAYMADTPDYSDVIVTVRADVRHTERGYYADSSRLLVGLKINVRSASFSGNADCISINEVG